MFYIFGFYKFCKLNKLKKHKNYFLRLLENNNTKGTIIFSKEGLNGTLSGSQMELIKIKTYDVHRSIYIIISKKILKKIIKKKN